MEASLSKNAQRGLVFNFILANVDDLSHFGDDPASQQIQAFAQVAGLSVSDATAAFAELEDAGMIERHP